jgi:hypothetical protein
MAIENSSFDGVIKSDIHAHLDEIAHVRTQPSENIILARNAELRKNPGAIRDLGAGKEGGVWGRQVASIPFNMFEKAIRDGYDLNNRDSSIATKEIHRYLASTEGKLCLVQGKN